MKKIVFLFVILSTATCGQDRLQIQPKQGLDPGPDCVECGPSEAPTNLDWRVTIGSASELGERILIQGIVYKADGKTPAQNVLLYIYHTNSKGIYPKNGKEASQAKWHGYLRGWLRTNDKGAYQIHTIKPGSYPTRKEPAHIHMIVKEGKKQAYYINDIVFEGDPLLTETYQANLKDIGGSGIVKLALDDQGIQAATRNIVLLP